jgi:hypothetical protein
LESLTTENAAKLEVAKSKMAEASMAAAKLVNGISPRVLTVAERIRAAREQQERAEAEQFGLAYTPSPLTGALAGFCNALKVTHAGAPGHKPSDMLHFITID